MDGGISLQPVNAEPREATTLATVAAAYIAMGDDHTTLDGALPFACFLCFV